MKLAEVTCFGVENAKRGLSYSLFRWFCHDLDNARPDEKTFEVPETVRGTFSQASPCDPDLCSVRLDATVLKDVRSVAIPHPAMRRSIMPAAFREAGDSL
jgi:hypothetical protein